MEFSYKRTSTFIASLILAFLSNHLYAQSWQIVNSEDHRKTTSPESQQDLVLHFDEQKITKPVSIKSLPLRSGEVIDVSIREDSIFEPQLQERYPGIISYRIEGQNGQLLGRMISGPSGITGIYRDRGSWQRITPITLNSRRLYRVKTVDNSETVQPLSCQSNTLTSKSFSPVAYSLANQGANKLSSYEQSKGDMTKVYRTAIATTAEYFQEVVSNREPSDASDTEVVLESIAALLNETNAIYQVDMALRFELVANNDEILFSDAISDGYNNNGSQDLPVNQAKLDEIIGSDNYDIGHVIGNYGGGLARLGAACNSSAKARGASIYNLGVFAHELGHMLGSPHTFNGTAGFCGDNIGEPYEPGSGSTIMSYFGLCGEQNLSGPDDQTFHVGSIRLMRDYIDQGTGSTCGTLEANGNSIPTAFAGADHVIPARTPFVLTGSGSDVDDDTLSFLWEQLELNGSSSTRETMGIDDGNRALFRTIVPVSETERYFPKFETVLSGRTELGEALPTRSRSLNMTFTVRDGKGGVTIDNTKIDTVATKYGFKLISPNANSPWNMTQPFILRWHTGKSQLDRVSCEEVELDLSRDNGNTFELFQTGIVNDGIAVISGGVIDSLQENSSYRLRLRCPGNVFYSVGENEFGVINEFPEGDTDWDGMPDLLEKRYGFDLNEPSDAEQDADEDGFTNLEEITMGTHPLRVDSDHDGTSDVTEIAQETDPADILSRIENREQTEGFEDDTPVFSSAETSFERTNDDAFAGEYGNASTNNNDNSSSEYSIEVSGDTQVRFSFYYKVSSESGWDYLSFYINGERQQRWSGEVDWTQFEGELPGGSYLLRWVYTKDASVSQGQDKAWLDDVFVSGQQELTRPSGLPTQNQISFTAGVPQNWSNSETSPWQIDNSTGNGDSMSLSSAEISDLQSSEISLTDEFTAQTMSFAYRVSSESGFDYLNFYVDGQLLSRWSGEVDWSEYSFDISAGEHTLKWEYLKDFSESRGSDKAWIDNVNYIGIGANLANGIDADFDADAKSELLLRHVPSAHSQYVNSSDDANVSSEFGITTDIPVTGDFDGDGYADLALRRPSTQIWYVRNSSGLDILTHNSDGRTRKRFGTQRSDIPIVGDYDGDGISDLAVRRPSTQFWYILNSSGRDLLTGNSDGITRRRFGLQETDIPVPADYDGDGNTDLAVRRPSNRTWYILNSSGQDLLTNNSDGISRVRFGNSINDIPIVADYDGDGRADLAVRRESNSHFYVRNSSGIDAVSGNADGITRLPFGRNDDIPVTGDYDQDGKADFGLYRPDTGQWFIKVSSGESRTSSDDIERWAFGDENSIPILSPITVIMSRLSELNE